MDGAGTADRTGRAGSSRGALEGVRVLDFTQVLAGPFCTQLLADQGADVVKVEPQYGDETRHIGPFRPDDRERAFGGYYASVNRNKRGIAIDLKRPEARDVVLRLAEGADVVVENYRPGVMDRLGIGYEAMRARNERLVYAAIRGFGDPRTGRSPYADWPALDVVSQAMGGLMSVTGPRPGQPMKTGPGVGDVLPASLAAFGIVTALLHARRTGEGQFLDVAMVDGVLALCERMVHQYSFAGTVPAPEGNRHPILCPFGLFQAKDGQISIAAQSDAFWGALCRAMDRDDLVADERFRSNADRLAHKDETYALVEAFVGRHTVAELVALLGGKLPIGPVLDVQGVFADPHFRARGMLAEVEHPGSATPVTIAGVPVRLARTPGQVRHRAPRLGEHTDDVLAEAGLGPDEIRALHARGVVLGAAARSPDGQR